MNKSQFPESTEYIPTLSKIKDMPYSDTEDSESVSTQFRIESELIKRVGDIFTNSLNAGFFRSLIVDSIKSFFSR